MIWHLDLDNFKAQPCRLKVPHTQKLCPYYHNARDRKRPGNFWSDTLCGYIMQGGRCPNGDYCKMAHSSIEQMYTPAHYKTKFCAMYPGKVSECEYGEYCSFAHSEEDITIELIHNYIYDNDFYMFHYKTVWCPFNLTKHDKALCVYAHNW